MEPFGGPRLRFQASDFVKFSVTYVWVKAKARRKEDFQTFKSSPFKTSRPRSWKGFSFRNHCIPIRSHWFTIVVNPLSIFIPFFAKEAAIKTSPPIDLWSFQPVLVDAWRWRGRGVHQSSASAPRLSDPHRLHHDGEIPHVWLIKLPPTLLHIKKPPGHQSYHMAYVTSYITSFMFIHNICIKNTYKIYI